MEIFLKDTVLPCFLKQYVVNIIYLSAFIICFSRVSSQSYKFRIK